MSRNFPKQRLRHHDPRLLALVNLAEQAGGRWRGCNKHWVMVLPSGRTMAFAVNASCTRTMMNRVTQLRRTLREEGILNEKQAEPSAGSVTPDRSAGPGGQGQQHHAGNGRSASPQPERQRAEGGRGAPGDRRRTR